MGNVEGILQSTQNIIDCSSHFPIEHIVYASHIGCERWHRMTGTCHDDSQLETLLFRASKIVTVLRSSCMSQDFLVDTIRSAGTFCLPLTPNTRVSWIDAADLAAFTTEGIST